VEVAPELDIGQICRTQPEPANTLELNELKCPQLTCPNANMIIFALVCFQNVDDFRCWFFQNSVLLWLVGCKFCNELTMTSRKMQLC